MRTIGRLEDESKAKIFSNFLFAREIDNEIEPSEAGEWIIWVHSEDKIEESKELLVRFKKNPDDPNYAEAGRTAHQKKRHEKKKARQSRTRHVDVRSTWVRGDAPGLLPMTMALIVISVVITFVTRFGQAEDIMQYMSITKMKFGDRGYTFFEGLPEIKNGQVWRLFTPMFVHLDALHLLFNMLWLFSLGRMIEHKQGMLRLALIVIGIGGLSNFGQYLTHGPNFGGMSGVVYGFLGYIWLRGKFDPSSGLYLDRRIVTMMTIWFLVCFALPGIANTAHAVGLGLGLAWGFLSSGRWKKFLGG